MVIKANNLGLFIDISMIPSLVEKFNHTSCITFPRECITKFRIHEHHNEDGTDLEVVELVDSLEEEFFVHFTMIQTINGVSGFTSNREVFDAINNALYGF